MDNHILILSGGIIWHRAHSIMDLPMFRDIAVPAVTNY